MAEIVATPMSQIKDTGVRPYIDLLAGVPPKAAYTPWLKAIRIHRQVSKRK